MSRWDERRPPEDYYRILSPDGELERDPPAIDETQLLDFYETLVLSRQLDDKMFSMQRRGELSLIARVLGEEATPLGSAAALEPGDWVFPTYRQAPAYLYWGVGPEHLIGGRMGYEQETLHEHLEQNGSPVRFISTGAALTVNLLNAVGVGMADTFADRDVVTLAYVGDGATSEGGFHEALTFAGVFDVPVVFVCQNNQWAISVPQHRQTSSETFAEKADAYSIPNSRVDGNDVLAVYKRTREAVKQARKGHGPQFIEAVTYRMGEHNTADNPADYREESEVEYWKERDPIDRFEAYLINRNVLDEDMKDSIAARAEVRIQEAVERVKNIPDSNPAVMFDNHLTEITGRLRRQRAELEKELGGENPFTSSPPLENGAAETTPFLRQQPSAPEINLVTSVRETIQGEMRRDDSLRLLGYDIGRMGGVFRATEELHAEFGDTRVIDTPLSENGILGTAVGMALRGDRVVPEIQFMGFLYPAFGQFMYTFSKMYKRSGGTHAIPITVRIPYGGGIKASEFHSESTETYLIHTPGVRVVSPSTPYEAKGLLTASIRSDDPVMFLEPKRIYRGLDEPVPNEQFDIPLDTARIVREGDDVTLLSWGAMVRHANEAAESVAADVEVIDLRTLSPLDIESVMSSVRKTGRCVVFHEARRTLGLGAELAALINEHALYHLESPTIRATGYDVHFPGHQLEAAYLPDAERAKYAIKAAMADDF